MDANGSRRRTAIGAATHTEPRNAADQPPTDEAPLARATKASKPYATPANTSINSHRAGLIHPNNGEVG